MLVNFEWNNGLIFGIAQDEIYCVETEEDAPDFNSEPDNMIVIYLGFFNLNLVFERDKGA